MDIEEVIQYWVSTAEDDWKVVQHLFERRTDKKGSGVGEMVDGKILKEVKKLIEILESRGVNIDRAYLYGSYAAGKEKSYSDIDVAIVSNDFTGNITADVKIMFPALKQTDSRIETVEYKPEDFRDEDPLVWEITRKGIRIK